MSAGYAALVSDDELDTRAAAELLGVSLDTVRAMIRSGSLPARLVRGGVPGSGRYVLRRDDVYQAGVSRAVGLRAGQVLLSDTDRAKLAEVRAAEVAAYDELERARTARAYLVAELGRRMRSTAAMAKALGVSISTVQAILRAAEVPVVHHRRHTQLTEFELTQLRAAQSQLAEGKANVDKAHDAREKLTKRLLDRGGYGVGTEIAILLGRHRSRLLSGRGKRRRQG
jgi:excisionase family DNA binding protein